MQRFERIYAEHHDAVRAYVRRRGGGGRNLFVSDKQLPQGATVAIRTLDANGNVTSTRQLRGH